MPKAKVEIANPVWGGSRFTSPSRAEAYVRRARGFLHEGRLYFYGPNPQFFDRLDAAEFERAVAEGRGDRLYWNGTRRPDATFRPGKVRA